MPRGSRILRKSRNRYLAENQTIHSDNYKLNINVRQISLQGMSASTNSTDSHNQYYQAKRVPLNSTDTIVVSCIVSIVFLIIGYIVVRRRFFRNHEEPRIRTQYAITATRAELVSDQTRTRTKTITELELGLVVVAADGASSLQEDSVEPTPVLAATLIV